MMIVDLKDFSFVPQRLAANEQPLTDWCAEHCQHSWSIKFIDELHIQFSFESLQDATLFRMVVG